MKLKLDEKGNVVVQDGMPVYVHEDGKEIPFDAPAAMTKITALNGEAKSHRLAKEAAEGKLKDFDGVDIESARKALETVKALDGGQLKTAEAVEKIRKEIADTFEADRKNLLKQAELKERDLGEKLSKKDSTIRQLMLRSNFESSPHFSGDKPKTTMLPDVAAEFFGRHFEVVGDLPSIRIIGKNPATGETILSRERYGEPANFEEAISYMIEQHPGKDRLLMAKPGGPGATGSQATSGKSVKWDDESGFSANLEKIASGEVQVTR